MISIIAALSQNRVIGNKGEIPWKLSTDLKRFFQLTKGHMIVMGRKTYESIIARSGKPLPNRKNIVISTQKNYQAPGCEVFHSVDAALQNIEAKQEVFIIGGGGVYQEVLEKADKLYLTHVPVTCEGDAFFPEFNNKNWEVVSRLVVPAGEKDQYESEYIEYTRIR